MTNTPIVIGNWKANPLTKQQADALLAELKKRVKPTTTEVVIAPPAPLITNAAKVTNAKKWFLGAQNILEETGGAYTGEISLSMLVSLGVSHVIVGHSERRARGETDEQVAKKVSLITKQRQHAIVCVGESERDKRGDYFDAIKAQVLAICTAVTPATLKYLTIAYEPIWAIGTGKNATPHDALEMKLFIQKILTDKLGRAAAKKVRILYGGSVKAANAEALFNEGEVDGFLVGGASLLAEEFAAIVKAATR